MHSLVLSILVTVAILLGGILSPYAAAAATYYVATSGNDANPGTAASPFRTIQKAAGKVNPGDTVIVDDGVYTDTDGDGAIVYAKRGGTSSAWVTFQSKNKWGAKLDAQNVAKYGWYLAGSYIIVQDFEVTGKGNPTSTSGFTSVSGNSNIQIIGNHIHHIGGVCTDAVYGRTGMYFTTNAMTIERNVFHDIGRLAPGESGCNPSTSYYQNIDHGIYIGNGSNVSIKNNIFYNHKRGWAVHIYPNAVSDIRILNNTFAFPNPYRVGHIVLGASVSNSVIANNIFYQPTTAAITYTSKAATSTVQVKNSITYGGTISDVGTPSGITFSENLNNTDPRLINPAAFDFHLQASSPAPEAGVTLTEVITDFDGVPRPQGVSYDIGAYEFNQQGRAALVAPSDLRINSQ